jgi:hypothetical protein
MRCTSRRARSTRQFTPEGFAQSITLFKQATRDRFRTTRRRGDGLARDYTNETGYGLRPVPEGARLAREAAEAALAADPDYAPAYDTLGWIAKSYDVDPRRGGLATTSTRWRWPRRTR